MKLLSPKAIGHIAHFVTKLLLKTYRADIFMHPEIQPTEQYVYGFWHGKQLPLILLLPHFGTSKHAGFVSASRDGEILNTWLKKLGYHVVRGSSSRKASSSVVRLLTALKEGYSVGIAADGPRGPAFVAKSGLAFLSYRSGFKVVPLGAAYTPKWVFKKSWDRYALPLPFAKIVLYFGQPIIIADIEKKEANLQMAEAIHMAEDKAKQILEKESEAIVGLRRSRADCFFEGQLPPACANNDRNHHE